MSKPGQDHRPVADPQEPLVPSDAMTALDPALSARRIAEEPAITSDQLSLTRRLRQPRTIISFVLPLILLALFVRSLPGFKLDALPAIILGANPLLLLAALAIFYVGFPLRGLRWAFLIRRTGYPLRVRDGTEIIFLSWLVNCLVPAKLGDIYRAYLLKINSPVSLSRTFGTVFIERVLDLFVIAVLGVGAGLVSFRSGLPGEVKIVLGIGIVVMMILAAGLVTMRSAGRRILLALPIPHTIVDFYDRFEEGVFSSVGLRALPRLLLVTVFIWATEAIRLYLVVDAFGFPDVHLGISGAFFVALAGSLLTAVPLTPAGIGVVETGVVGLLTLLYGVPQTEALAIVVVDRSISVLSIIVLGSIAYAVSPRRRGAGLPPVADQAAGLDPETATS